MAKLSERIEDTHNRLFAQAHNAGYISIVGKLTNKKEYFYQAINEIKGMEDGYDNYAYPMITESIIEYCEETNDNEVINIVTKFQQKINTFETRSIVLDLLIKTKKEQVKYLQASKEELLSSWRLITEKDNIKS